MHLAQITGVYTPSTVYGFNSTWAYFLVTLVGRILLFAIIIAGFTFLVRIIMAGFTLLTAAGEPGKIKSATQSLTHAITGLIIVISAFFLAQIIQYVFGLQIL